MEESFKKLLKEIGENPERKELQGTLGRIENYLKEFTKGYRMSLDGIVKGAVFEEKYRDMIIFKDIEFVSLCEHHLLPFFGKCSIGYIPEKKIIGLSKLPEIVEMYSRRLQLQERLTNQIAHTIEKALKPNGIGVVMEATHTCMLTKSFSRQSSNVKTSSMLGSFR